MQGNKPVQASSYTYASGRIRALEIQLLDSGRTNRLAEARTVEDIARILADSGYPAAANPEASLNAELVQTYDLLGKLFPDQPFLAAMLLFHDFHNLKVILKTLTAFWPKRPSVNSEDVNEGLPEASMLVDYSSCETLFLRPSLIEPHTLFLAVRDRQPENIPEWLYDAAVSAARHYQATYDISDIDQALDQAAFKAAFGYARQLQNDFFCKYLACRADLINLGLLLRTRFLHTGESYLTEALIPGGTVSAEAIRELYDTSPDQIMTFFAATPYKALAELAASYGQAGTATRFSLLADNLIIEMIRPARMLLRGPEILLAYLIAREMEIKNIRIVLTCLRNGLPASQAREIIRDSYLTWR